jgi:hypothetical protein
MTDRGLSVSYQATAIIVDCEAKITHQLIIPAVYRATSGLEADYLNMDPGRFAIIHLEGEQAVTVQYLHYGIGGG